MHALFVHMRHPAQRWYMFQNMGPSPSGRSGHAMASHGTRIFVVGGESSGSTEKDQTELIKVLDTSAHFLFVISFGQPPRSKMQSTSNTQNMDPTLTSPVRRPPNSRRSHPRVPRPMLSKKNGLPLASLRWTRKALKGWGIATRNKVDVSIGL